MHCVSAVGESLRNRVAGWRLHTLEMLIGTVKLSSEILYQFVLLAGFIYLGPVG